ncbi:MAG: ATPase P [Ruminococcus sp.]|nr:ATPase P [Ruminococcus sp.]
MFRTIVKIEGMMCGMCEKHVNNAVSRAFVTENITSSHKKGETEIISESAPDEALLRDVIEKEDYKVLSVTSEPFEKKKHGLFGKK